MKVQPSLLLFFVIASCGSQPQQGNTANESAAPSLPASNAANDAEDEIPVEPAANTADAPAKRVVLSEPKGPIDPKSVEAAGQVVQLYGALLEQNRVAEAAKL